MILNFSFKLIAGRGKICCKFSLYKSYRAVSSVPVDILWEKLINITDFSWHPLISSSNAPHGLIPKPGLIYQVVTRLIPIRLRIFVERVRPRELLSVRVLTIPGVEKRVTYQVESTLCGSYISYSVSLRGWLSPLVWLVIKPYAARVASELARAAEQIPLGLLPPRGLETSE
ncbi:MAG: SRPBCC family protein [Oscillatoria sp. PMC 1051.18]|uniref:SRPBCC family protein n=1 Tax=Oscillatoria salina TaxID=331517 RepID=UPI0013BB8042|nr:SRPBCC family protein [Oscillatoria salina]MBZ8181658.1 SRPBCC family protein [Oscillatoria salina IIICB1]MEC4893503.1 SRPBCC family protein [Oscillatoria sp. PMC 1050.18]MEC5030224.1 SRPBCC family protein [Oscillatoria sp. PMC 1051.18]NET88659.1 SRPBCC family protein [Kamptonema sp. SIO1D9]